MTEDEKLAMQRVIVTVWQLARLAGMGLSADGNEAVKLAKRLTDEIEALSEVGD